MPGKNSLITRVFLVLPFLSTVILASVITNTQCVRRGLFGASLVVVVVVEVVVVVVGTSVGK